MAEKGIFFRLARKDEYYAELKQFVADLRKDNSLTRVLRNGLLLMWDLLNYRTDVLLSLFPWIKEAICEDKTGKDDIGELRRMIEQLTQKIAQQQVVYVPTGDIPDGRDIGLPLMQPAPKQLGGLQKYLAAPVIDDDDDPPLLNIVAAKGSANGANLLSSMFSVMD